MGLARSGQRQSLQDGPIAGTSLAVSSLSDSRFSDLNHRRLNPMSRFRLSLTPVPLKARAAFWLASNHALGVWPAEKHFLNFDHRGAASGSVCDQLRQIAPYGAAPRGGSDRQENLARIRQCCDRTTVEQRNRNAKSSIPRHLCKLQVEGHRRQAQSGSTQPPGGERVESGES